jgi:hypothetical protein
MPGGAEDGPRRKSRKVLQRGVDTVPVLTYVLPERKQFLLLLKALAGVNLEEAQRTALVLLEMRFDGVPHGEWRSVWEATRKGIRKTD